jgi:Fe-S-cluster containining protein
MTDDPLAPDFAGPMQSAERATTDLAEPGVGESKDGSTLCTSCGFCCDGLLFSWAGIEPEEAARIHLPIAAESGQLAQPCVLLHGTSCSAYAVRPKVCHEFRCKLLRRMDSGQVSIDQALKTVARARALRGEVESALPPSDERLWRRVEAFDPKGVIRQTVGFDMPTWAFAAGALWGLLGRDFIERNASASDENDASGSEEKS